MSSRHARTRSWVILAVMVAYSVSSDYRPSAAETGPELAASTRDSLDNEQGKLYIAPDSPAFTFLGVNPATVSRPTTTKGLAIGLANAVDSSGRVVQGFALEFVPVFFPSRLPLDLPHYQKSFWTQTLANTRVTLGTARASGDSASTDLAIGLNMPLFDLGDPMRDPQFTRELETILLRMPDVPMPAGADLLAPVRPAVRALRHRWLVERWNARRTVISAVTGLRFLESRFQDTRGLGASVWLVDAEGIESWGQFLVHLQYDYRRHIGKVPRSQKLTYGARLNAGSAGLNGYLELAGFSNLERNGDPAGRWSGGIEFKLSDGLWASTGLGSEIGSQVQNGRVIMIANLRWAIAEGARMSPRP